MKIATLIPTFSTAKQNNKLSSPAIAQKQNLSFGSFGVHGEIIKLEHFFSAGEAESIRQAARIFEKKLNPTNRLYPFLVISKAFQHSKNNREAPLYVVCIEISKAAGSLNITDREKGIFNTIINLNKEYYGPRHSRYGIIPKTIGEHRDEYLKAKSTLAEIIANPNDYNTLL